MEPHVLLRPGIAVPLPFFSTTQRVAALNEQARSWLGTPWCANSEACGPRGGVSCHNLPRALYVTTGALHESFPRISGLPDRHSRESRMEKFLDARPEFQRVQLKTENFKLETLKAGDLLGLRLWYCIDHIGVLLDESHFIHVLMHKLTTIDDLKSDPTWSSRLLAVWRPVC